MPPRPTANVTHPGGYGAGRVITLEGVRYEAGEQIPDAVVARCKNANALLSRRWIVPVTTEGLARARNHPNRLLHPQPTHLSPTELRRTLES